MGITVAQRQEIERDVCRRAVQALLAAGYTLVVDYGGGVHGCEKTTDEEVVMGALFACDEEALKVFDTIHQHVGWVFFVYGNDGWDVINDYTVGLEKVLQPVNDYVDAMW